MRKIIYIIISFILISNIGKTQENLIKNTDLNSYNNLDKLDELNQFGYKYEGKKLRIHCYFWRIYNDDLGYTNEGTGGINKRKLVGFKITNRPFTDFSGETQYYFINTYGFQKDILDILQNLKQDDEITILGTVVPFNIGDEVGFRVDKIFIGNNNNVNYSFVNSIKESNLLKMIKNYWYIILIGFFFGIDSVRRKKV
jgi:hypothetical protein